MPKGLLHYPEEDDHNKVLYHNRGEDTVSKTNQVLNDAAIIISACGSRYDKYIGYQLLIRDINEQTKFNADGNPILKDTHDGIDSNVLLNPADPNTTYHKKAGTEYRGYLANVVEVADKNTNASPRSELRRGLRFMPNNRGS